MVYTWLWATMRLIVARWLDPCHKYMVMRTSLLAITCNRKAELLNESV
jgi:hypothetical protein